MRILRHIMNSVILILLLGVLLLFLLPLLPIPNGIEIKIVESGSMEPAIKTGSLVLIMPASTYEVGDVITFKNSYSRVPTTHRVAVKTSGENGESFLTKGDANEEADNGLIYKNDVIGKVFMNIPYAGFILDFARKPVGFSLLIVLPALLIVLGELEKIYLEYRKIGRRKETVGAISKQSPLKATKSELTREKPSLMMDIMVPVVYKDERSRFLVAPLIIKKYEKPRTGFPAVAAALLFSLALCPFGFVGSTVSYFNDVETATGNSLSAASVDFFLFPGGIGIDDFSLFSEAPGVVSKDEVFIEIDDKEFGTPLRYEVSVNMLTGNAEFCQAVVVSQIEPFPYDGPLLNFWGSFVGSHIPLSLSVNYPPVGSYEPSDFCAVEFISKAYNAENVSNTGYFDEEVLEEVFYAPWYEEAGLFEKLFTPEALFTEDITNGDDDNSIEPEEEATPSENTEPLEEGEVTEVEEENNESETEEGNENEETTETDDDNTVNEEEPTEEDESDEPAETEIEPGETEPMSELETPVL